MLRLASDADVHGDILRGLWRRTPELALVRSQDVLPLGTSDPEVLRWSAASGYVLITNDRNTMVGFAKQRLAAGEPMPGLIVTSNDQAIGAAIDDILLIAECLDTEEMQTEAVISCRSSALSQLKIRITVRCCGIDPRRPPTGMKPVGAKCKFREASLSPFLVVIKHCPRLLRRAVTPFLHNRR